MISVEHLTKCYGEFVAVDDLSFSINEGRVYGFLGPNGAGKSTTMNIITGCLSPTQGRVLIDGHDILEEPDEAKKCIGYLPELPPLYLTESPEEYLSFVGRAKGLRGKTLKNQVSEVIRQTRIEPVRHRRISALSKGYRQRVGIAQALLGNPGVIILDEPTVGLDPIQIIEIRDLIKELGRTHTVILSSHILSEVQAICDQVMILNKGRLIAFDTPDNLEKQLLSPNEIRLTTDADADSVRSLLASRTDITSMELHSSDRGFTSVILRSDCEDLYEISRSLYRTFASSRWDLLEMSLKKASLEEIFLELTDDTAGDMQPLDLPEEAAESEVAQG